MAQSLYNARILNDPAGAMELSTRQLYRLLAEHGVVIIRSAIEEMAVYGDFVKSHSARLTLDPARTIVDNVAQLVDSGTAAIGLHCENGNSPIWPDLTWFYCQEAPTKGSQTTLCDGASVLAALTASTRRLFEHKRIRYSRLVPSEKWRKIVTYYNPRISEPNSVKFDDIKSIVADDPDTQVSHNTDDDSIHYRFTTSAIQNSPFTTKPAFANSILGPSFNYEAPVIDFEDGSAISNGVLDELREVTAKHTHAVGWQDNDVAMIDNRRVMHGRQQIIDTRRTIFNALSYRKEIKGCR